MSASARSGRAVLDGKRLLDRLDELARCAPGAGGGVTRLAWSEEDRRARALLAEWSEHRALSIRVDAAGNLIGELAGKVPGLAPLVIGSHLDTVVDGGPLDGAYGVVAAFEILSTLARSGERLHHPLRAVAWANEEGVVAPPFSGSRVAAGLPLELDFAGPDGLRLDQRLLAGGGDPDGLPAAAWEPVAGYLELHVEQGPVLERAGIPIGCVTGITGQRRGRLEVSGVANHAGTTPMGVRHDALVAAARAVLAVEALATDGPAEVATVGALEVVPGVANVVAGRASLSVDVRSLDEAALDAALAQLGAALADIAVRTRTEVSFTLTSSTLAVRTDPGLQAAVADAAAGLGLGCHRLASGAGHDAGPLAALGPVGMIFVPSLGGVSHSPAERTEPSDLVAGARVLLDALRLADTRLP